MNLQKDRQWSQVWSSEWDFEGDDLLLFNGQIYVPDNLDLQRRIIAQHHDSIVAGHPGCWKTLELISRSYWWPNMSRMIGRYTKTCKTCLQNKILRSKPIRKLHPIPPPQDRWCRVSVDFIRELLESRRFNAIMACVDSVSKQAHFIPTVTTVDTPGTATLYRDSVWKLHGLPEELLTDRGSQFASEMMKELLRLLGIKRALTMAYHPQSDGQTEHIN
jgi:transposase InsO family protein